MTRSGRTALLFATAFSFVALAPSIAAQGRASAAAPNGQVDPAKATDVLISTVMDLVRTELIRWAFEITRQVCDRFDVVRTVL
jgi:hypothetical protein